MKKNQATYKGTRGPIIKDGVIGLNSDKRGFVNLTNTLIKKNCESSLWNIFIATLPIKVHIITPIM
tara:strand:- start:274 stop:471 length:198 start_codon:yes stop_codon:yes gene_type:complete